MKNPISKLTLMSVLVVLIGACATSYQPAPPFTPVAIDARGHALKTQNVVVVLDASSSMAEGYQQWKKFDLATAVVRNMAATIPEDLGIISGLRTFGHDQKVSMQSTELISGMGDFNQAEYTKALSTVFKAGGTSPMGKAIDAVANDLDGLGGNSAMIIFSDGKDMGAGPVASATAIKAKFGESLCIYPILIGDDAGGRKLMDALAQIGGCGFATNAEALATGQQMAGFVGNVFIGAMVDSDGDGVPDTMDKCPGTPAGVKVDAAGCPLDSDGDGVPDTMDKCPGTPAGVKVDAAGCPVTVLQPSASSWTFNEINFAVGKADITPSSYGILNEIAAALSANPQLKVVVEGHTDNTGARAFNMDLSQRRAQAVVNYLVEKGVSPSRLSAAGYGPDRPIADNATKQGRAKNRRVQLTKVN